MFIIRDILIIKDNVIDFRVEKINPYDINFVVTFTLENNVKIIFNEVIEKELDIMYENLHLPKYSCI